MNGRQCEHVKDDGSPCGGAALTGRQLCVFHDPSTKAATAAGRRKGGQERSRRAAVLAGAADVQLTTVQDVKLLIALTISQVRRGELDVRVGNCIGFLAGVFLKTVEVCDLADQVAELRLKLGDGRHDA
jgi:hypothetical protein